MLDHAMHPAVKTVYRNDEPQLCFETSVFLKESFSIDDFLRNHRNKSTLEQLRNDLGTYLKDLRMSMIELINKDYEDFVNLSKDLVGLNDGIEVLQAPLENVKSEINMVRANLQEAIDSIRRCLNQTAELKRKKQCLFHVSQVLLSLKKLKSLLYNEKMSVATSNLDFLERVTSEYTMLQFSVSKCQEIMSLTQKNEFEDMGQTVTNLLKNSFLSGMCEQDADHLKRCLGMFASLDSIKVAEQLVKKEIVTPFLYDLVNESSLKSQTNALQGLYRKVLEFIDTRLNILLSNCDGDRFNFLVNSLWTELTMRLEIHTSSIFSAGDPQVFHLRYKQTTEFINNLKSRCSSSCLRQFNCCPQTAHFLQKWNLLVYYKIRFHEIAGQLEYTISEGHVPSWSGSSYHTKVPAVANLCLQRCWDDGIFLPELTHMFWRLSLQTVSRFCLWVKEDANKEHLGGTESAAHDANNIQNLISLHSDTSRLAEEAKNILENAISLHSSDENRTAMESSTAAVSEQLTSALSTVSSSIVRLLVKKSVVPLSNVNDIPRLFRRTNREMPTKPCEYVNHILEPVTSFHQNHTSSVNPGVLTSWMCQVLTEVSSRYLTSVSQVLDNAQKTEESLRRLKKANTKLNNSVESKGPTDDDKIRQQLVVDVHHYRNRLISLGLAEERITLLKDLISLVEKARDRSDKQ